MKFDSTLDICVKADLAAGNIPMLLGEPGIGKSSWLIDLARQLGTECFVLPCNQLADKADLTGARLVPTENGSYHQVFYPHEIIDKAITYASENPRETPLLFMDELNRTTPDVTSEALSIPTLRAIGSRKLPDNLRVVIAGNDKGNVTALDDASISRFVLYDVQPDVETFVNVNPELNEFVKSVLSAHPECIFQREGAVEVVGADDDTDIDDLLDDGEEMKQITCPRTLAYLSEWLNHLEPNDMRALLAESYQRDGEDVSILQDRIEGHIGRTPAAAYILAEIATNITRVQSNASVTRVVKPSCYDRMKTYQTQTDLDDFVATMTDNERSGCMLYCLYEKADNRPFVSSLANTMTMLDPEDTRTLMMLAAKGRLDRGNLQALIDTGTEMSNNMRIFLDMSGTEA